MKDVYDSGKKKDTSTEEDVAVDVTSLTHKKHKKHKHKKHKRKRERLPGQEGDFSSGDGDQKPALKLKIKFGSDIIGKKGVAKVVPEPVSDEELHIEVGEDTPMAAGITGPSVDSDISDEDAWLEALESGKLDEYDEMKRMKDPALMTARQRALLESKTQRETQIIQELQMLPLGYKEKEMTEEMLQKKAIRAKKRRQAAQEKREKDKRQTIDRLLKKQETKVKGGSKMKSGKKTEVPKVMYLNNSSGITLSFPPGYEHPLQPQKSTGTPSPSIKLCGVHGCPNPMKYSCSKTGTPLCSLGCYKSNLQLWKLKTGL